MQCLCLILRGGVSLSVTMKYFIEMQALHVMLAIDMDGTECQPDMQDRRHDLWIRRFGVQPTHGRIYTLRQQHHLAHFCEGAGFVTNCTAGLSLGFINKLPDFLFCARLAQLVRAPD